MILKLMILAVEEWSRKAHKMVESYQASYDQIKEDCPARRSHDATLQWQKGRLSMCHDILKQLEALRGECKS